MAAGAAAVEESSLSAFRPAPAKPYVSRDA